MRTELDLLFSIQFLMNRLTKNFSALGWIFGALLAGSSNADDSHWAFEPIREPDHLPQVSNVNWAQNPIDLFILSRQEAAGFQSSAQASKTTLIRRATFDLTGLPPSAKEVETFLNDQSPDAWSRLIQRLLDSQSYGERWGRHWLDVVRYADTAGETADYPSPAAWRYRNYVIDSFNSDKPYNQFIKEQIAGDILASCEDESSYAERVTATGFLAISRRFGFDSENYHHLTIQDTLDTVGQSILGLTIGCARCHDHKFDPISAKDYYALYGIFESSNYSFPGSEQKSKVRSLAPLIPPDRAQSEWTHYRAKVADLTRRIQEQKQSAPGVLLRSLADLDGDFELQAPAAGGSRGVLVAPWVYSGNIEISGVAQSPYKNIYPTGRIGAHIPSQASAYSISQAIHDFHIPDVKDQLHFSIDFRIGASPDLNLTTGDSKAGTANQAEHQLILSNANFKQQDVKVYLATNKLRLVGANGKESSAAINPDEWYQLQLRVDFNSGLVDGAVSSTSGQQSLCSVPAPSGSLRELNEFRIQSSPESLGIQLPALSVDHLSMQGKPFGPVSTEPNHDIAIWEGSEFFSSLNEPNPPVEAMQSELRRLLNDGPFKMAYGVMEGTPRDSRVQMRGEPDQLGEAVPRRWIEVLGGQPVRDPHGSSGRSDLAEWLTSPSNPLTPRVIVNRVWSYHFGQGLVKTPNDFGIRGAPPTHPELLEHLSVYFMDNGWSIKALHRHIMSSATYQLASVPPDSNFENAAAMKPTDDLYLSHQRRRLDAEEIRDAILAVTGELDRVPGKEHPFPDPISWGYSQHGPFSAVYDHKKRSVYLMSQRIKRHPFLALFDGSDPNASTAQRTETIVPTQSLYFLNDPFVHACADAWAKRLQDQYSTQCNQITQAWSEATGTPPSAEEISSSESFLQLYASELKSNGVAHEDARHQSLAALLRTLFAGNPFLYID